LATVGKRLELARQQEAQVSQKVETLTREASSRADELSKAEVRLQQSREATAAQEQQLSTLRTQVSQVAGQLSDLNKELAARNGDLSRLEDQLQAARKRLSETGATGGSGPGVPGAGQQSPATPSPAPTGGATGQ
jgi:chromosome segregation ATPase